MEMRLTGISLYLLPVKTRMPLKFGAETLTSVTCLRARVVVQMGASAPAEGWGETPLSVQWVWPGGGSYQMRYEALVGFAQRVAAAWLSLPAGGHPLESGWVFQETVLPPLLRQFNAERGPDTEAMPWLAALLCCASIDLALHDAFGHAVGRPVYETYGPAFLKHDLADILVPAPDSRVDFRGLFPENFLAPAPSRQLPAWHLLGGLDPLTAADLKGTGPGDGYPVLLADWVRRDGIRCLKIKLRGNDAGWDFQRTLAAGLIALGGGVEWLSLDFNCTVQEPAYVCELLDRLMVEHPRLYGAVLYVEQPFPYELEDHRLDVRCVSARKPLFLDESAHDWRLVGLGRQLGWTGVALKTCKTQTQAILSACWARAHGMTLMVQDLTNPMLAQIPHVLLAAHVGTIMGVETNAMQFYPEASAAEARVHPGLYRRQGGQVDWSTVEGSGFGYRLNEIARPLPEPLAEYRN